MPEKPPMNIGPKEAAKAMAERSQPTIVHQLSQRNIPSTFSDKVPSIKELMAMGTVTARREAYAKAKAEQKDVGQKEVVYIGEERTYDLVDATGQKISVEGRQIDIKSLSDGAQRLIEVMGARREIATEDIIVIKTGPESGLVITKEGGIIVELFADAFNK